MYAIIEKNGEYIMGLMLKDDESGETIIFKTKTEAENYAKENCAFEYSIVAL